MNDSRDSAPYALSFTSGALLAREAVIAAPLYLASRDWNKVRKELQSGNLLQLRTEASRARLCREVVQRLAVLTDPELELVNQASPSERGYLMWVAACRRYAFIGDFAEEVVRERFLLLTPKLGHDDFDGFVLSKSLWHPELSELKESTFKKLRSTIFRMLVEAGLLVDGRIVQAILSQRVNSLLETSDPTDLRFFPTRSDKEEMV